MKKALGTILLFSFMIFCFGSSLQAGSPEGNISSLKVDDNTNIYFSLINGSGTDNGCTEDSFVVASTLTRFDEIYQLLLVAKSNNFRVATGISGCVDSSTIGNVINLTLK